MTLNDPRYLCVYLPSEVNYESIHFGRKVDMFASHPLMTNLSY